MPFCSSVAPLAGYVIGPCESLEAGWSGFRATCNRQTTAEEVGRLGRLRGSDQNRTLMRHARVAATLSMGLLALAMILPAGLGHLVSAARCPQLLLPHSLPTGL